MQALKNSHTIRVLFADCDPAGIVHFANYYRWMDEATYHLFIKAGLAWERLLIDYDTPGFPVVSAHAEFSRPVRFGETLSIESQVSNCGRSSYTVSHLFSVGGDVAAEGWEKRVWCSADPDDRNRISAVPLPPEVRTALGMA